MTGNFISGTRAASAGSGLGFNSLAFSGTIGHAVAGGAENPLKFPALAFWAFEFYFLLLIHNEQFNKFFTF
jgi:hypothetical protein